MTVKIYEGKFEKVVKYYYPNGEEYEGAAWGWYFLNLIWLFIQWALFPFFWLADNDYRGIRKVYYVKFKEKKE